MNNTKTSVVAAATAGIFAIINELKIYNLRKNEDKGGTPAAEKNNIIKIAV